LAPALRQHPRCNKTTGQKVSGRTRADRAPSTVRSHPTIYRFAGRRISASVPASMSGRIQKHALERLNFVGEVSQAERLAACKTFLRLESAMIRMRHDAAEPGLVVARARASMIDVMLAHLFDYAISSWTRLHGPAPAAVCLVALGGYGRGELCPLSDVDIMFLFPSKVKLTAVKPLQEHLINEILYILWDCGLKVGHSTRTVDDVFAEARKDIQTKTALLESRLIAGSESLYETFAPAYESFYRNEDPRGYIAISRAASAACAISRTPSGWRG
jgi:[protein-PII] uridylyltransferase